MFSKNWVVDFYAPISHCSQPLFEIPSEKGFEVILFRGALLKFSVISSGLRKSGRTWLPPTTKLQ
jgi:hypothetical protein